MKIADLPSEFLLTELQIECLAALPQYIVQNYIQVVNHKNLLSFESRFGV
jgi:hypothetical protein